jgi:protein-S-isoprenylcysteine O-methyltransferase Ste14
MASEGVVSEGVVTKGQLTEGPVTEGPVTEGPVTEGPVTEGTARRQLDVGRLVMVPFAMLLLALDVVVLTSHVGGGLHGVLRVLGTAGSCVFYLLMLWCYLRRGPAIASSSSVAVNTAAVAGNLVPLAVPLLHGPRPAAGLQLVADILMLAGICWSVWSLRSLGRNLSVIPQARGIADHGPYAWVRHPLYLGEIVATFGTVLAASSVGAIVLWVALCGLQVFRAVREERVLLGALPGYDAYRARTAVLIPGIF